MDGEASLGRTRGTVAMVLGQDSQKEMQLPKVEKYDKKSAKEKKDKKKKEAKYETDDPEMTKKRKLIANLGKQEEKKLKKAKDEEKRQEDEEPTTSRQACELVTTFGKYCCLCSKWSDGMHQASAKHRQRLDEHLALAPDLRKQHEVELEMWARQHLDPDLLRGGAGTSSSSTQAPKSTGSSSKDKPETKKEQRDDDVSSEVQPPSPPLDDVELQIALANSLCGPSSIEQHERDVNMVQRDMGESEQTEETTTESYHTSTHEQTEFDTHCMLVQIGRRMLQIELCEHPDVSDIVARVSIDLRVPTRQAGLCRGDVLLTFTSMCDLGQLSGKKPWKAIKLPMAFGIMKFLSVAYSAPDDIWNMRCPLCALDNMPVEQVKQERSSELECHDMQAEDYDVVIVEMERDKDCVQWHMKKGCKVADILHNYAGVKRVRESSLRMFHRMDAEQTVEQDMKVLLKTRPEKKLRGGSSKPRVMFDQLLWCIHDYEQKQAYLLELMEDRDDMFGCNMRSRELWYLHARLHQDVSLGDLRGQVAHLMPHQTVHSICLRSRKHIMQSSYITLAEYCEWLHPRRVDATLSQQICLRWAQDLLCRWHTLTEKDVCTLLRGGGGKGQLRWESTHLTEGVTLLAEIKVGTEKLAPLKLDQVCTNATGIVCSLMSSWTRLADVESNKPLIVCFPGRCIPAIKKLGKSDKDLQELDMFVREPEAGEIVRRRVTLLSLSHHEYTAGDNIKKIDWAPKASIEMLVEMDSRWAAPSTIELARRDWKGVAAEVVSRIVMKPLSVNEFYATKLVTEEPYQLWQTRIRMEADLAERLVCGSGREACFVRPAIAKALADSESFTLIWAKKHTEASPTSLAGVLQTLEGLPGHRGVARSLTSLGVRVRWEQVKAARMQLTPHDPRFVESTLCLRDGLTYKLEGVPSAATSEEVARFCRDLSWPAIPQRRVPLRGQTVWWVTSEGEPPEKCVRWSESYILISKLSAEEKERPRTEVKKAKKETEKKNEQPSHNVIQPGDRQISQAGSMGELDACLTLLQQAQCHPRHRRRWIWRIPESQLWCKEWTRLRRSMTNWLGKSKTSTRM